MTLLDEPKSAACKVEPVARFWRPWFLVGLSLLFGLLIFAHGCHGDEDHELLTWLRAWTK